MKVDRTCLLCGEHVEDINHVLFQCRVSKEIWELSHAIHLTSNHFNRNTLEEQHVKQIMNLNKNSGVKVHFTHLWDGEFEK